MNHRQYLKHLRRLTISAWFVLLLGDTLNGWHLRALQWVENGMSDARAHWVAAQHTKTLHPQIVILDIDEESLSSIGRWPWSRVTLAEVIERAFHPAGPNSQGVRSLGIDILLSEPERTPGADAKLAATLARYPIATGWFLSGQAQATQHGTLPMPLLSLDEAKVVPPSWPKWHGYTMALDAFDAVSQSGVINGMFDDDGKVRRVPMLSHFEGQLYESLALSTWRSTLAPHSVTFEPLKADTLTVQFLDHATPPLHIPLGAQLDMHLRWRGFGFQQGGGFDYISVADLLAGRVSTERLAGKYALLGSSAAGMIDLRATPVHPAFAGVEIQALVLAALLDGRFDYRPYFSQTIELLALLVIALIWWRLRHQSSAVRTALTAAALSATWLGLTQWLYMDKGWLLPIAAPLMLIVGWLIFDTFWGYWLESQQRRQFVELFGQYVPPQLVARMAQDPQRYSMAPQSARLSILFSDVRGFTSIAESLSPDDLREYINAYLSAMSEVVAAHDGTLDKFIGDAVMAFWGAPVAQDDHTQRSVRAALAMLRSAQDLNTHFEQRGWPTLKIGVGLNCGEVRVGDMGSRTRRAYTVMGDAVNLASRLEGLCKLYGCTLIVSEYIQRECPNVAWLEVDTVRVKGKEQAVTIATALAGVYDANQSGVTPAMRTCALVLQQWRAMKLAYLAQNWEQALKQLDEWQSTAQAYAAYGQGAALDAPTLAMLYRQRIAHYKQHPPSLAWDGVTRHEEK